MAFMTALAIGAIAAATGVGAYQASKGTKESTVTMPEMPKYGDAAEKAKKYALERQKAAARVQTVQTSPLGVGGEAQVIKKRLLGQ